jgi:hypothetical protein
MFRLAAAVLTAGVALGAAQGPVNYPRTKLHGRATVQYQDERVRAVAIYDYSQRHHNQAWLLVQFGVALSERAVVRRESFHLIMPGGPTVPLATQEQCLADAAQIRQFRQNASIFRQYLTRYFPKSARSDAMQWVALPGEGLVGDLALVPGEHAVAIGDLYFKSPTMQWEGGHASARLRSREGSRGTADTP